MAKLHPQTKAAVKAIESRSKIIVNDGPNLQHPSRPWWLEWFRIGGLVGEKK
jgi:hypothetical protein